MRILWISLGLACAAALGACGGDDDGGGEKDCAAYCTAITANCTGANQQYASAAQCMAVCNAIPAGATDDMAGNTMGCRTYHAGAAQMDPVTHCTHAGPGGAGVCGSNCEGFCTIALSACTGDNEAFDDMAACMTACGGFSATEKYDVNDTMSNTFACRLYHVTVATGQPNPHCKHVTAASTVETCGGP